MNSSKGRKYETAMKPLVVGVVSAIAASQIADTPSFFVQGVGSVPLWLVAGTAGMASSYISEIGHNYLYPALGASQKNATLASTVAGPAIAGASLLGVLAVMNPFVLTDSSFGVMKTVLLGAGSEVAGSYLYDGVLKPRLQ